MKLKYYAPKYWGIWTLLGVMRLIVLLPYSWQLALGRWLGRASMPFSPYRKHITEVNLKLCFPDLSKSERRKLLVQCFESTAMGMMESAMAWWMPDARLQHLAHFYIPQDVITLLESGTPLLICGAHFTCLEIVGRLFALKYDYHLMYRKHRNPLFNHIMTQKRLNYVKKIITRKDVRDLIRSLRKKIPVWYAPDQDYGPKHSVFAPFFGIPTASITGTSRLAKLTKAKVIPVFYHRLENGKGYELIVHSALENFPSGDEIKDATHFNQLLEDDLRKHPDQYLWQHRRFKTRPLGETKPYLSKKHFKGYWYKQLLRKLGCSKSTSNNFN